MEGDCVALRLCMDRIAPPPKDAVTFSMPTMSNALDASKAARNVLRAASAGELTPLLELTEIEERLRALETANDYTTSFSE